MTLSVKPIAYGLRKDETLFEIINRLEVLESIVETTFKHIDDRIATYGQTFADLSRRTDVCADKVRQLKTWGTKASKVFSSHKYPKNDFNFETTYQCIDYEINDRIQRELGHKSVGSDLNNNSKTFGQHIPFDDLLMNDKMKLLSISPTKKKQKGQANLGTMPSNRWNRIQSLSSLLIFNTSELAFTNRSLKTSNSRAKLTADAIDSRLSSAPASIGTPAEDINELHYGFGFGIAPQMDTLPLALPSLPGIADEFVPDQLNDLPIQFETNNQTLMPNKSLPILPSFDSTSKIIASNSNGQNSLPSVPPPPPPPPPPSYPQMDSVDGQAKSKSFTLPPVPTTTIIPSPPQTSPPAPPPPPPSSLLPTPPPVPDITISSSPNNTQQIEPNSSGDTGRASLLESIRMAGGRPKKTVKERKIDQKIKKKESQEFGTSPTAGNGGDLMSDLMKRLALRRDGISGLNKVSASNNQKQVARAPSSAMDRVSALIPAPVDDSGNEESDPEGDWAD